MNAARREDGAGPSLRERLARASERPIVIAPSLVDLVVADGEALANALRRRADSVIATQRAIVEAGAEILLAPTACTTALALHATGQAYRAAALTAVAVDLSRDAALAAGREAFVVGEVPAVAGARAGTEARTHVDRLVTSGADGVLVFAEDPGATKLVAESAAAHGLPLLAEVLPLQLPSLAGVAASGIIVRCHDIDAIPGAVEAARAHAPWVGVRIAVEGDSAQLLAARAWAVMAPLGVACVGAAGPAALATMRALVDLARAPRVSVV